MKKGVKKEKRKKEPRPEKLKRTRKRRIAPNHLRNFWLRRERRETMRKESSRSRIHKTTRRTESEKARERSRRFERYDEEEGEGDGGGVGRYIPERSLRHPHRREKAISGTGMV